MKNKLSANIIIDVILFVILVLLSLSSFVMEFCLPCEGGHGCGGGHGIGTGAGMRQFWGMNRHMWGDIHMRTGMLFIIMLTVHIIMHWGILNGFMKKHIPALAVRYLLYFLIVLLLLITVCPWFLFLH